MRTRTTLLQAHTHQWLGTFGQAGNADYRGELLRGLEVIAAYQAKLGLLRDQALIRLDGQYGNGAIVADLLAAGIHWLMRGKDYGLLDLASVKERLALPADEQFVHAESGICRDLFECGDLPVTAEGHRSRVIIATHPAGTTASPIGVTRDQRVYELFFTALPALGFSAADVVKLYLHRGSFETVLADEGHEQDSDRWSSYTPHGQETWQILSHWMWNLRQELSQQWQPTSMRLTKFSPPRTEALPSADPPPTELLFGPPQWARAPRVGSLGGRDFLLQADGTLRCRQGASLYPQERRPEHDGTVRVLSAARIADCRICSLRPLCQEHGTSTKKPRRVSAVLHPLPPVRPQVQPRRAWIRWQRSHLVTVQAPLSSPPPSTPAVFSRAQRAHWRMTWPQRLARNARPPSASPVGIMVYRLSTVFAQALGLRVA